MDTNQVVQNLENLDLIKNSESSVESTKSEKDEKLEESFVQCEKTSSQSEFYGNAQKYWSEVPATVNGMLGGLGYITAIDVQGSIAFLRDLKKLGRKRALDCGAGIGRVSRELLIPRFDCVDLVEQDTTFASKARQYCLDALENAVRYPDEKVGVVYNMGLQEFVPQEDRYDLIWSQWVLGHLTDEDLLRFFQRVKKGLTKNGYFVMKENVTSKQEVDLDEQDSSVTRPLKFYEKTLKNAGFRIIRTLRQQNFPKGLYPVYMIACRPLADTH